MGMRTFKAPPPPHNVVLPFQVLLAGHWKVNNHKVEARRLNEWVILFCEKGSGYLKIGNIHHQVKDSQIFICPPGESHGYGAGESGWNIHWIHAEGPGIEDLIKGLPIDLSSPIMDVPHPKSLIARFQQLFRTFVEPRTKIPWEASCQLHNLLLFLLQIQFQPLPEDDLRSCFLPEDTRLDDIASRSGLSRFHFCRRFKDSFGLTPWKYLTELKVDEAKKRLLQETTSIKVIAIELGFPNPDYFSRVFKKTTGRSPSEYRGIFEI